MRWRLTTAVAPSPSSFSSSLCCCWLLSGTTAWSWSQTSLTKQQYRHLSLHHQFQHKFLFQHHRQQRRHYHRSPSCLWSLRNKSKKISSSSSSETTDTPSTASTTLPSSDEEDSDSPTRFATDYHVPVMWKECISALLNEDCFCSKSNNNSDDDDDDDTTNSSSASSLTPSLPPPRRIFVDGTLGGGGHTEALVQRLQLGDVVYGCDVDQQALEAATKRLLSLQECYHHYTNTSSSSTTATTTSTTTASASSSTTSTPLFIPVHGNFGRLHQHPSFKDLAGRVDGILLDLGVSSHQIDTVERGFTFTDPNGPLDMRMNNNPGSTNNASSSYSSLSAADLCNELDVDQLALILKKHGDEPRAKRIAQSIIDRRPLRTTGDLQQAVAAVTPSFHKESRRKGLKATLARVFQALRIVVNQEDAMLEQALTVMAPTLLKKPGGRLVVLSYHSLEDRATKQVMRDGRLLLDRNNHYHDEKDLYGNYLVTKPFRPIGKALKASAEEVAANPRARSAVLRVAEKL